MPIVSYALASYLAGLFAGFADSLLVAGIVVVIAALAGHTRKLALVLAALAVAGFVAARDAARRDAQCAEAANRAESVTLVVDDSVAPGAYTRGHLVSCSASVAVFSERGTAAAG